MISGYVNSELEPIIVLTIKGPSGKELSVEAVVDTGYSGYLTLAPDQVRLLSLPFEREGTAELADGSWCMFDMYAAEILWDEQAKHIPIDEQDAIPLVGMGLLYGHELRLRAIESGSVNISRLDSK
jgi:clan AA aspartic protease